jgi:hypothetical protein
MYFRLDFLVEKIPIYKRILGCVSGHGPGAPGPKSAPVVERRREREEEAAKRARMKRACSAGAKRGDARESIDKKDREG